MYRPATRMATRPLEKLENPHLSHQFSRLAARCASGAFVSQRPSTSESTRERSRAWSGLLGRWDGGGLGSLPRRWSERTRQRSSRTDGSLQRTCNGWSGLVLWRGTRSERLTSTTSPRPAARGSRPAARGGRGGRVSQAVCDHRGMMRGRCGRRRRPGRQIPLEPGTTIGPSGFYPGRWEFEPWGTALHEHDASYRSFRGCSK
jgi:hypothetical protein